MKTKIVAIAILFVSLIGTFIYLQSNNEDQKEETKVSSKKPDQFIVVLDLSDRITRPGQIETDKQLIEKIFAEFDKRAKSHLLMNSKDRFQVYIAPQKGLPFDKDVESEKLTLDLPQIKRADRVRVMEEFKKTLRIKLDSLYAAAYKGDDSKNYQGSNLWQFFNETLASLTNDEVNTRLVVITDGYFDFEENNPRLTKGHRSTTTNFLTKLREQANWQDEIKSKGYGILPVNQQFKNLAVCVSEIRTKDENNLNETEMLRFIWNDWLTGNGIAPGCCRTILHTNISSSGNQLGEFLAKSV